MERKFSLKVILVVLAVLHAFLWQAHVNLAVAEEDAAQELPDDLTEVGLQALLNFDLVVSSPSKKEQKFSDVASAVSVLTQDDIRRSGATNIMEALRLVPGVNVAKIDASRWAITARGFNDEYANKLLVLVDGQSIFTPSFNGVVWDQQELVLEDIDRIEVIRGPGAAFWGSNAVNGVINIITKSANDTQGGLVSSGGGNEQRFFAVNRYGGMIQDHTAYRVYGRFAKRDGTELAEIGGDNNDEYDVARGGIRTDSKLSEVHTLTTKTEGFYVDKDREVSVPSLNPPFVDTESGSGRTEEFGGTFLTKLKGKLSEHSEYDVGLNYTYEKQDRPFAPFHRHTMQLEGQHRYGLSDRHEIIYGAGYRLYQDRIEGSFIDDFEPPSRTTNLVNFFLHDEITVVPDTLKFIVGSKFENNDSTGFEVMPSAKLLWTPDERSTIWGAVSRAVANPPRVYEDVTVPVVAFPDPESGLPTLVTVIGDRGVEAENLIAYEAGFRQQLGDSVSFDLATFYNDYTDLVSAEPGTPYVGMLQDQTQPAIIVPIVFMNELEASSYGGEIALEVRPAEVLRFIFGYSYLKVDVDRGGSLDEDKVSLVEDGTAQHTAHLRIAYDLSETVELDTIFRYTDRLATFNVDAYLEADVRVGWKVLQDLELALVGQNLLDSAHQEFADSLLFGPVAQVERGVYGKLTWTF